MQAKTQTYSKHRRQHREIGRGGERIGFVCARIHGSLFRGKTIADGQQLVLSTRVRVVETL